ncbi:MAG: LamG-like jellyroll fold domain-containing protein [Fidelibacterota bacterium]
MKELLGKNMKSKQTFVRKSTRRISLFIFFVTAVGQFAYSQDPTISGEITYPSNQFDYPSGKLFIPVWKNPSTWPFPPENEYPITEEIIFAPDLNYPVNYTVEVTGVAPGDFYYVAAFLDEDTTMQPQEPEAEAWYPDGFELDVASAENVNMELGPIGGVGFSFDFGATGGYAETNFTTLDGGPEITMEMFIRLHSPAGPGELYEFIHRENWGFLDYVGNTGEFRFSLGGIGEINWQYSPNPGEWHHIAADYDGVNMALYWDGELKATLPISGNLPGNTNPMRFGEGFDGLADIIRISDIALYQGNNFDPWTQDYNPTSNTFLLYNCNEGSGNQLIDESGEGHNATITGNPTWDPSEPLSPVGSSLWISGSDINYIDLSWDRWPDADGDFVRYELHRNTVGGVTLGDPVILDETDVNVLNWRDNNVSEGNNYYYKLWMYDQGGIRYETNEVSATPGAAGGHVDGNIHSDESASGELIIGLFSPDNGGDDWNPWDPDFQQNWSATFPSDQGYQFDDPGIWDGFGWEVRAFVDENSDWNPNPEELQGVSGEFEVTGGSAANINFDLYFGSGGNGRIDFTINSPQIVSGNIYIGIFYNGDPTSGQPDVDFGPVWHDFNSGNYSDFIDGIVEGDDYAVAAFFDRDGSPNASPDICDAGQDMVAVYYDVDVWGTINIGTVMLADCGSGSEQVTVTFPNGGETFTTGEQMAITWDWTGSNIGLDIYLSRDSGGNYDYFITTASSANEAYSWIIPESLESANCRIGIIDPGNAATFDGSDNDFSILSAALGEFATDYQDIYLTVEASESDTFGLTVENSGAGEFKISNVTSTNSDLLYVSSQELPINVVSGEEEIVQLVSGSPDSLGTYTVTLTFFLENATVAETDIEFTLEVLPFDSVTINSATVPIVQGPTTDLPQMTLNVTELSVSDGVLSVTYVDGSTPRNGAGGMNMAVADRYWELVTNLDEGDITADLCFDLSGVEGIDDFMNLKILKRPAYSDDIWELISDGDLVYDEINNVICAYNQSSFSQWTVGSDSSGGNFTPAAPEILSITGDGDAYAGQAYTINVDIIAEAALERVELRYVLGGETVNRTLNLLPPLTGLTWTVQVPEGHVTYKGFFFVVEAEDENGKVTTSNPVEVRVNFSSIDVRQIAPETYTMISIPGDLSDQNIEQQFGDELGTYDPEQWRVFRWKNQSYVENSGELQLGNGFWIISRNAVSLQAENGLSTHLFGGISINLESGWNMVGNPYAFDVNMSDVEADGGAIEPTLYEYNGGGYNTLTTLQPGRGYWLYAYYNTTVSVKPLGAGSLSRTTAPELTWQGRIKATSGELIDEENFFGTAPEASTDWDVLDRHEPPVIGEYISLAFDNDQWTNQPGRYSRDIHHAFEAGHVWPLTLITNRSGYVTLSVDIPEELPVGWELYLVDTDFEAVQNLSARSTYEFTTTNSEVPRRFELIAGPPEFTREAIGKLQLTPAEYRLTQNIPNPFNATTTIQFNLPEESEVSIFIYDLVGRKVATVLPSAPYTSGGHFVIWDGKDNQGRSVSSGVYLYRLEARQNGKIEYVRTRKLILLK